MKDINQIINERKELVEKLSCIDEAINERRKEAMINALADAIHEYFGSHNVVVEDRNLKWREDGKEEKIDISQIYNLELSKESIKARFFEEDCSISYIKISEHGVEIYNFG